MSDDICREHGVSVIETPSKGMGLSYKQWLKMNQDLPWKEKIREDIRECIIDAHSYDDFIKRLRGKNYVIEGEELPNGNKEHDETLEKELRLPIFSSYIS